MVFRLKILLIVVGMCFSIKSNAQHLQDLWEKTKEYYSGFDVQKQQILLAKQDSIAQQIKYKPQVQAQFQQSLSSLNGASGSFMPLPGILNMSGPNDPIGGSSTFNHFISGTLNWDLVNFGRKGLDKDISSSKIEYSKLQEQNFIYHIQQRLTQRYIEFIYLNVLNEWFEKHAERYTSILEITKGLAEAGIVPGADTLLASSSLKNVESNLLQIKGKVAGSRELLKEFAKEFNPEDTEITPFLEVIDDTNSSVQEHPLFLMKRNEAESLQLLEKKTKRNHFPRVMLLGGLTNRSSGITSNGYVNPNYSSLYKDFANNYFVGFGVTWNLQDLFNSRSQRSSLGLKIQNNEFEQEVIQNEIQSHIAQLEAEIIASDAGIKESNLSRAKAEEAYLLYKARFEGGLINLSDLLQVQEILLQTERQNLMAYLNYWNLMISKSYQQADFSQLFTHF